MVKRRKSKFKFKAKSLFAIILLSMIGMLDVMLIVNPNDMVFCTLDTSTSEQVEKVEDRLLEKLDNRCIQPSLKENYKSKEKLILKGDAILKFDTLNLSDAPNAQSEEILLLM